MKVYEINKNKNILTIKSKKKSYTFDINKIEYFSYVKGNKKSNCKIIKKYKINNIKNLDEIIDKILKNKYCYFASKPYHKYTEFHKKTLDGYEDEIVIK